MSRRPSWTGDSAATMRSPRRRGRRDRDTGRRRGDPPRLADAYAWKYDDLFGFTVSDGRFRREGSEEQVLVFELAPAKGYAFGKGTTFSQTRWRFPRSPARDAARD